MPRNKTSPEQATPLACSFVAALLEAELPTLWAPAPQLLPAPPLLPVIRSFLRVDEHKRE